MHPVDYEQIAESYDRRYTTNEFAGIERCLRDFLGDASVVAELGCGTGHWLELASALPQRPLVVGLDNASAMIERARQKVSAAAIVRASAQSLPWRDRAFERVFCINALHHFPDRPAVYRECARVLRARGAFMTIGLDPHTRLDRWWIYDYFPDALQADTQRYPSADSIRSHLTTAGFERVETVIAQHIDARLTFDDAHAKGFLGRGSTSQLLVIDDTHWHAGLAHLQREKPVLEADLRLYATIAYRPN